MSYQCIKCGTDTDHTVEVEMFRVQGATLVVCAPCFEEGEAGIRPWRERFEMLLANGVSRERANEIIIERMDRERKATP